MDLGARIFDITILPNVKAWMVFWLSYPSMTPINLMVFYPRNLISIRYLCFLFINQERFTPHGRTGARIVWFNTFWHHFKPSDQNTILDFLAFPIQDDDVMVVIKRNFAVIFPLWAEKKSNVVFFEFAIRSTTWCSGRQIVQHPFNVVVLLYKFFNSLSGSTWDRRMTKYFARFISQRYDF